MDKNTGLYIVLGFLLLCILLSLDMKEGFATINVGEFETACNTGENTCIVESTGARGGNCLPNSDERLYNLLPGEGERDLHKETFNITAESCSESGYNSGEINVQPCESEGQPYILSGCAAKCSNEFTGGKPGYNVSLPPYVSPIQTDDNDVPGVIDIGGSCTNGLLLATNTCFNRDGTINGESSGTGCATAGGIWYDGTGNNSIKLVCDNPEVSPNYSVIGCEPACYSRMSELGEYMATPDDLGNENKEIIQILHRPDPSSSSTEMIMPQNSETPYLMTESSLNPGAFSVTGTNQSTNFSSDQNSEPISIDFSGEVASLQGCNLSSPNTDLQRKYPVSGLFPVCDSQTHECLNFNITYDSPPLNKMNIEDFKNTMNESAREIGIPQNELDNYKNSLYYYRRYKDTDDKTHIEGQIRCDNDPSSPFHCIITDQATGTGPIYGIQQRSGGTCDDFCNEKGLTCTEPYIYTDLDRNGVPTGFLDDLTKGAENAGIDPPTCDVYHEINHYVNVERGDLRGDEHALSRRGMVQKSPYFHTQSQFGTECYYVGSDGYGESGYNCNQSSTRVQKRLCYCS